MARTRGNHAEGRGSFDSTVTLDAGQVPRRNPMWRVPRRTVGDDAEERVTRGPKPADGEVGCLPKVDVGY